MGDDRAEDGPIDPGALIAALDPAGHVARAEAYFAGLDDEDPIFRKPFQDPARVATAMGNLFSLFSALKPARGLGVLDHGCGTGWLTRILARLGLRAVGCDVSATVLAKAEAFARQHEPDLVPRLSWIRSPDGVTVPLPDAAVERTVMYGAFHHLHDQAATLAELGRVLAEDGRAVFIEPGPAHSRTAESQEAMRRHGVIENDVRLEEIWPLAQAAGFDGMEVALGLAEVPFLPLPAFQRQEARVAERRPPAAEEIGPVIRRLDSFVANTRHFVLTRAAAEPDTRSAQEEKLRGRPLGRITVLAARPLAEGIRVRLRLENVSRLRWRASGSERGAVNLGAQLVEGETVADRDFRRLRVSTQPLPPGAVHEIGVTLPPPPRPGLRVRLDLVAEGVCWFQAPVEGQAILDQALPER